MTTVSFTEDGFQIRGHADYAEEGSDIVCAAVSALSQGTLIGLTEVLNAPCDVSMDEESGQLLVKVLVPPEDPKREGARLLIETLRRSLAEIARQYPRNVRIINPKRRESKCIP